MLNMRRTILRNNGLSWLFVVLAVLGVCCANPSARKESAAPLVETAPAAVREGPAVLPSGTVRTTLENGLTVVLRENRSAPIVNLRVLVKTGSIYEDRYLGSGISHLTEHLVHSGETRVHTEEESRRILERIGNVSNAYTSYDSTVYFIETSAENFDVPLDLLSDWMKNCTFPQEHFEREHGVVQRELERSLDSPHSVLNRLAFSTVFQMAPIRHPVLGELELLKRLTREDVVQYYHERYRPNRMIFAAAGDFRWPEALDKVRTAFADFPPGTPPKEVLPEEPPQLTIRTAERRMDVQLAQFALLWQTVPLSHRDLYALDLLSTILSWGESSRLVRTLRNEQQLVYSIRSYSYTPAFSRGVFSINATLEDANVEAAQAAVLEQIRRVREVPVGTDELARAKQQNIAAFEFERQTVGSQSDAIARNMASAFDPDFDEHYVKNIQRVTAEQILDVANRYLRSDNYTFAAVRPKSTTAERAPIVAPEAESVQRFELDNGIRLLVRRNPAYPTVALSAYFLAGLLAEDEQNNGITSLMARVLPRGTESRTAEQIAELFDSMGGSLDAGSGNNTFYITSAVLKADFKKALDVFADVIMNPTFSETEVERMRQLALASIRQRDDDPGSVAMKLLRSTLYNTSPYRLDSLGTEESVRRLTPDDLRRFHAKYCVPANMILAIFGDIDPVAVKASVEKAFAKFKLDPNFRPPQPPAEPPLSDDRSASKFMERENAHFMIAFRGPTFDNIQDRARATLLQAIMSGLSYPTGWIFNELRGRQLVYAAHGVNWPGLQSPGFIAFTATCQPEKVPEVAAVIRRHIERARCGDISDEEFQVARQLTLATLALGRQTNADMAGDAALNELYGLSHDFSDRFPGLVRQVTKEDLAEFAQKYFTRSVEVLVSPLVERLSGETQTL